MIKDYYSEIASLDFDDLVKNYCFSEICQKSVPQAIYCFLISDSLEDTLRNCVLSEGIVMPLVQWDGRLQKSITKKKNYQILKINFSIS